ncbi:MAG: amidohydrolase family protein [Candidatus Thioglobus sp.]|nr:amidohydrolase family protein [Candidatus Thioglobus sp.]
MYKKSMINLLVSLAVGLGIVFSSSVWAKNPEMAVKKKDRNGDGKVSLDEWPKSEFIFNKIDFNGDGFITANEFAIKWGMLPAPSQVAQGGETETCSAGNQDTPVADVHFHAMLYMTPYELKKRMKKFNIQWIGGVGAAGKRGRTGPQLDQQYLSALGNKYVWAAGQNEINYLAKKNGTSILEGNIGYSLQSALDQIDRRLSNGAKAIGEIHVNTTNSAPIEYLRRRLIADSPLMQSLWGLSVKHDVPMIVHMEFDDDSAEELQSLVESDRDGTMVLGHCGKNTSPDQIRTLLEANDNVYCNLAFRSPPQSSAYDPNNIYDSCTLKSEWKDLIEDHPDRFMVGIDDTHSWETFDKVAENIRSGLLANLSNRTAEKVAYKNAVRIYNLEN